MLIRCSTTRRRSQYKARLRALDAQIEEAEDRGSADVETFRAERAALIHELAAATGLGGRARRLGDPAERARKTVSARVRDALSKIDQVHPELARHLRDTVHMGTHCVSTPPGLRWPGRSPRTGLGYQDRIRRRSAQIEADRLRVDVGSSVLTTILGSACLRPSVTTR